MTVLLSFLVAAFTIYVLYPIAVKISLVDRPSERKLHQGDIPLIGGLSIFIPIVVVLLLFPELIPYCEVYILCSTLLLFIGCVDDKVELSVRVRMILISAISVWMITFVDFKIGHLGDLLGSGDVVLTDSGLLFTVIAVIGSITAFNMVDGLDGLLGGLAIVTLASLALLFKVSGQINLMLFCCVVIAALTPYVICNLGLLPNRKLKIFMGDSGSLFIGFTVVWLLIESTQSYSPQQMPAKTSPVTSLWIIAIPLMDMAYTMLRRLRNKKSPFKPDRDHIHHVLARLGLSPLQTLIRICTIAVVFATVGIAGELLDVPDVIMCFAFIIAFIAYFICFTYIEKATVSIGQTSPSFK